MRKNLAGKRAKLAPFCGLKKTGCSTAEKASRMSPIPTAFRYKLTIGGKHFNIMPLSRQDTYDVKFSRFYTEERKKRFSDDEGTDDGQENSPQQPTHVGKERGGAAAVKVRLIAHAHLLAAAAAEGKEAILFDSASFISLRAEQSP